MEKNFNFGTLLRNNETKQHKRKPPQFGSVASGVQKRLQNSLKNRKSHRCTIFDSIRDIPECDSPPLDPTVSEAEIKIEHRRQQLERWKAEKDRKKKEAMAQKKKPFVAGIARAPMTFVLPPPLPRNAPGTSGRVTRSQSAKAVQSKPNSSNRPTKSFAPKNATFRAPEMKTVTKPVLAPPSKSKNNNPINVTFEPVISKQANTVKQTRSRTAAINRQTAVESSLNRNKSKTEPKSNINTKLVPVAHPRNTRNNKIFEKQSSSSGSDVAPSDIKKRIKTPGPVKSMKEKKILTPKVLHLSSTSSDEKSDSEEKFKKRKSVRKTIEVSSTDENLNSESTSSVDLDTVRKSSRKSLPKEISQTISSDMSQSSPHDCSSDLEFISEGFSKTTKKPLNTPKNKKILKSESSSEEKLRSPKSAIKLTLTPEQMEMARKISPCVTFSRGKDNARKEMKYKINKGYLDYDAFEGEGVEYFRYLLASETDRMTAKCLEWDQILEQSKDQMPEAVEELVLSALGQARLLMSQKLQQFRGLVERCANPETGTALVITSDLRGFWDMVLLQVKNVDMKFKRLEELKACNWIEVKPVEVKKKAVPKIGGKKTVKPAGNSRLRDMIAAARKAKSQNIQPSTSTQLTHLEPQKTFEAGFFSVLSPVKSPGSVYATPRKESTLLKAVLSSEAKKSVSRQSASFAMLRASTLSKYVECEGVAPLQYTPQMTPINLYATPGRSILKSSGVASAEKSGKKSIKVVLFSQPDTDLDLVSDKPETAGDTENDEKSIIGIEKIDESLNIGTPSMEVVKTADNKENKAKEKIKRQDAMERISLTDNTNEKTPMMTRLRRKSMRTPKEATNDVEIEGQDAMERISIIPNTDEKTPMMTRLTRKSMRTPKEATNDFEIEGQVKSTKRSSHKKKSNVEDGKEDKSKTLAEEKVHINRKTKTPRQRKKANAEQEMTQETEVDEKAPKRSTRKKALQEVEVNVLEPEVPSKRSPRMRRKEH